MSHSSGVPQPRSPSPRKSVFSPRIHSAMPFAPICESCFCFGPHRPLAYSQNATTQLRCISTRHIYLVPGTRYCSAFACIYAVLSHVCSDFACMQCFRMHACSAPALGFWCSWGNPRQWPISCRAVLKRSSRLYACPRFMVRLPCGKKSRLSTSVPRPDQ